MYGNESFESIIISRCKKYSPNTNDFFEERRYLIGMESSDFATPSYLKNLAISCILQELSELGLEFNDINEINDNPVALETMFWLRRKFDNRNFYNFLKNLDSENYAQLQGVIEGIELAEDYLLEIGIYLRELLPLDIGWDHISDAHDKVMSTELFRDHITSLMKEIDNNIDPNRNELKESLTEYYGQFLQSIEQDREIAHLFINEVIQKYPSLDYLKLQKLADNYDSEKLHPPETLEKFVINYKNKTTEPSELDIHHHKNTPHHIEYYVGYPNSPKLRNGREFPSREDMVMMMISFVLDKMPRASRFNQIDRLKTYVDKRDEYSWFLELASLPCWEEFLGGKV